MSDRSIENLNKPYAQSPDTIPSKLSAKELITSLRDTTIPEILHYVGEHWESEVRVRIAKPNEILHVPPDWHGAQKFGRENIGDAEVLFGSNLVTPIEGTRLPADAFIDGLHELGFVFENGNGKSLKNAAASGIISSEASCMIVSSEEEKPVMRAIKNDSEGKIIIEVRNGSMSPVVQKLTVLGNTYPMNQEMKPQYRHAVADCLGGFCAKGATAVRKRLDLFEFIRSTDFDDCLATGATMFGSRIVDDAKGRTHTRELEEIRVSVASTQAIALAVWRSLERDVPLLVRTGALSYGLGNKELGSNYLINTQDPMIELGVQTVGDMGDNLSTGREKLIRPHVSFYIPRINGSRRNETRIYLGGGLAMFQLWEEKSWERNKEPDGCVYVLQASRINPPPEEDGKIHDWGVLLNGKTFPVFEQLT
jgi:hypothetical protein